MSCEIPRRTVALAAAAVMLAATANLPLLAADPAVVTGKVYSPDRGIPRAGVVVRLVDAESDTTFDSAPTSQDGAFRIDSAPAGEYVVLAKDADHVYLAADGLMVAEGRNAPVALTLDPVIPVAPAQATPTQPSSKSGLPTWGKAVIAGGIGIAALFLANEITQDEEETQASPF